MKSFSEWLRENGMRTAASGNYPPAYGLGQYPPLYFTPISATAGLAFEKPKKRKKKKKSK